MIKELMHDPIFLAQKSETADRNDIQTANDLRDTLEANRERCVGMAANMIGMKKRIICFVSDGEYMIMFNPEIIKQSDPYDTEEGCLSLLGGPRKCKRYKKIKGEISERGYAGADKDLFRFYRPDNPARDRPLQRHTYMNLYNYK